MADSIRPVRFCFDDGAVFDGFTDGTTWNGFLNVEVTPEVHAQVIEHAKRVWGDPESVSAFTDVTPKASGHYSYAYGFATQEVEEV